MNIQDSFIEKKKKSQKIMHLVGGVSMAELPYVTMAFVVFFSATEEDSLYDKSENMSRDILKPALIATFFFFFLITSSCQQLSLTRDKITLSYIYKNLIYKTGRSILNPDFTPIQTFGLPSQNMSCIVAAPMGVINIPCIELA